MSYKLVLNLIYNLKIIIVKVYFFLLLVLLYSCEKPSNCDDHYFTDDFKSFVYAEEGSYWVFQDTLLGLTDTITIISQDFEFSEECSFSSQPHETIEHTIASSHFIKENGKLWHGRGNAQGNYYDGGLMLGFYDDYNYLSYDSILMNDIWYYEVREYSLGLVKFLSAKNIGIIQREFTFIDQSDTLYNFQLVSYVVIK